MCIKCKEALDKHFPGLPWPEKSAILMELTAYPFADGDYTANQIAEIAQIGLPAAYKKMDEEMTQALGAKATDSVSAVCQKLYMRCGSLAFLTIPYFLRLFSTINC